MKKLSLIVLITILAFHSVFAWELVPGNGLSVTSIAESADGHRVILGLEDGGMWISNNSGLNWICINSRLISEECQIRGIREFEILDSECDSILARVGHNDYTVGAYFFSFDGGLTWEEINTPNNDISNTWDLLRHDSNNINHLYYLDNMGYFFESFTRGTEWIEKSFEFGREGLNDFIVEANGSDTLFIAKCGILTSHDAGSTWNDIVGFPSMYGVDRVYFATVLSLSNGDVLAIPRYGTNDETGSCRLTNLCRSTDKGLTWTFEENSQLPDNYWTTNAIEINGYPGRILAIGNGYEEITLSTDFGHSFIQIDVDPDFLGISYRNICQNPFNSTVYVCTEGSGVYKSIDGGQEWTKMNNLPQMGRECDFRVNQNYVSTNSGYYRMKQYGFQSHGWSDISVEGFSVSDDSILYHEPVIHLGNGTLVLPTTIRHRSSSQNSRRFILRSENGGESWDTIDLEVDGQITYLPSRNWLLSYIEENYSKLMFVEYDLNDHLIFYTSTDAGLTWYESNGFEIPQGWSDFQLTRDAIFASYYNTTVYMSTDNGDTWINTNLPGGPSETGSAFLGYDPEEDELYAYNTSYQSIWNPFLKYNGTEWIELGEPERLEYIEVIPNDDQPLILGSYYSSGLYFSRDGGYTFSEISDQLPLSNLFPYVESVRYDSWNNRVWICTALGLMYTDVETLISVENPGSAFIPLDVKPIFAYPNPFNASVNITYKVVKTGPVELKLFNINGREVATLVDEVRQTGYQELSYDASSLASGVYFLKFNDGTDIHTQKITLVK